MELFFLLLLVVIMISALSSGFPVAFALPGAAILTIGLAALVGWLAMGDASAYFMSGGPTQWLSAGVTNFRGVYWEVERDTLIAIPLFIFMGIMLQRSKIAEDLLVAMGRLFGPVPGGLGISVIFVGALLAATTGIVGATVVAMGLISLPAMLRNGYSAPLATGTICASGTLGQIIPPSIVLIILADQLASAADQAANLRQSAYKAATGEFSIPAEYAVTSASAGDMFLGAFIPGLILVGLYMGYVLIFAFFRPQSAPPVPYDGKYDGQFFKQVALALIPPLALIFAVLGSIMFGIATVNQAGAIGAIGAMIMAGYRLANEQRRTYWPVTLVLLGLLIITYAYNQHDLNIKNITSAEQLFSIKIALVGVGILLLGILWSGWRTLRIDNTLYEVMVETAKTTSMVFIILIGAAMLTAAFRGFGGEELVKEFLHGLPGGFWGQFIVVMAVIFILGFFLDFIEIAVVVVPIVAPILLADPSANITAVWLGVMIGMNIQTSFLTPPFGFALFYLRGVAPPEVRTTDIYKGASIFIGLQLVGLAIVGFNPPLVNYLPVRTQLTSETAPPPINPRLQSCLETYVFDDYINNESTINQALTEARQIPTKLLPEPLAKKWDSVLNNIPATSDKVATLLQTQTDIDDFLPAYADYHRTTRAQQRLIHELKEALKQAKKTSGDRYTTEALREAAKVDATALEARIEHLQETLPEDWKQRNGDYRALILAQKKARGGYRRHVDTLYKDFIEVRDTLANGQQLEAVQQEFDALVAATSNTSIDLLATRIKTLEKRLDTTVGTAHLRKLLSTARRALTKKGDVAGASDALRQAQQLNSQEATWRIAANAQMSAGIAALDAAIARNMGLRQQSRLNEAEADFVASCLAEHRDISLAF